MKFTTEELIRNIDEFGTADHGPTNYTAEQVVHIALMDRRRTK